MRGERLAQAPYVLGLRAGADQQVLEVAPEHVSDVDQDRADRDRGCRVPEHVSRELVQPDP